MVDQNNASNLSLGSIIRTTCKSLILEIGAFCNRNKIKSDPETSNSKLIQETNIREIRTLISKQHSVIKNLFSIVSCMLIGVRINFISD